MGKFPGEEIGPLPRIAGGSDPVISRKWHVGERMAPGNSTEVMAEAIETPVSFRLWSFYV